MNLIATASAADGSFTVEYFTVEAASGWKIRAEKKDGVQQTSCDAAESDYAFPLQKDASAFVQMLARNFVLPVHICCILEDYFFDQLHPVKPLH